MAGERIGKAYEAVVKVLLDSIIKLNKVNEKVFWNEQIEGLSVEPDFTIGTNKNNPNYIIMVTHSLSSKNATMKLWRNIGEVCEAKTVLTRIPYAINIIFDASIGEGRKELQKVVFDGQLIIGDLQYGSELLDLIRQIEPNLPTDQVESSIFIKNYTKHNARFRKLIIRLSSDLKITLAESQEKLQSLWIVERCRKSHSSKIAKNTFFRRGFTKRLLIGDAYKDGKIVENDGTWLEGLGIVKKTISGYKIVDNDVLWFLNTPFAKKYRELSDCSITSSFKQQISKVRSFAIIDSFGDYFIRHYDSLITVNGMIRHLIKVRNNPAENLIIPKGVAIPNNLWIYDYIAALSKAESGKAQSFGYASFTNHPLGKAFKVGNVPVGEWCNSYINQFFSRKKDFIISNEILRFVASVLSDQLKLFSVEDIIHLKNKIKEKYISKELEAVLLAHRGCEPLFGLLLFNKIAEENDKTNIRACFAEKAGLTGVAGCTTVVKIKNTIINWQTATDSGRDHKRKELSGRAVGLRYTWDEESMSFIKRPNTKKLILLIDGTWRQKDIDALLRAGWDEIYYPDEIDKLKKAII